MFTLILIAVTYGVVHGGRGHLFFFCRDFLAQLGL